MKISKKNLCEIVDEVLQELSATGGGTAGASFSSGTGEQAASKYAFVRKKLKQENQKQVPKGWKKVTPGKIKGAKGVIHKDLWKETLNEISSREYSKSVSATPSQKSRNAYRLLKRKLREIEKILEYNTKLREEVGEKWRMNEKQITFIQEKMRSLQDKVKKITKLPKDPKARHI